MARRHTIYAGMVIIGFLFIVWTSVAMPAMLNEPSTLLNVLGVIATIMLLAGTVTTISVLHNKLVEEEKEEPTDETFD